MFQDLNRGILDALYEGVYIVNTSRVVTFWNKGAERITGFRADEIVGKYCNDNILNHIDNDDTNMCLAGCPLHKTLRDGKQREKVFYLHHKDGHRIEVSIKTLAIYENGEITGAAEVFSDGIQMAVTNRAITQLKNLALYDHLTELPNRRYIDSYLTNRLAEFEKLGIVFSVITIDIDHFKAVNDTYGHEVGDQVLKMIATTMRNAFRKNDFLGRWGGEEFLAAVVGVLEEDLSLICEKIRLLVKNSILRLEQESISVTISIGSTVVQKGDTAASIQKRSDDAMYISKQSGRDKVTIL